MTDSEYKGLLAHIHAVESVVLLLTKRSNPATIVADLAAAREAVLAAGLYSRGADGPGYAALVDFHLQRIECSIRELAGLPSDHVAREVNERLENLAPSRKQVP